MFLQHRYLDAGSRKQQPGIIPADPPSSGPRRWSGGEAGCIQLASARSRRRWRDVNLGRRARPGPYQCPNRECRFQFAVTTRTPLHSTKLPLRVWLTGLWLILQSDKGISSVRLAEAIGVSQPSAWRMGHALRLLLTGDNIPMARLKWTNLYRRRPTKGR